MKGLLTTFVSTGDCELNIPKVLKAWKDNFCISRQDGTYRFVIDNKKGRAAEKVSISEQQAKEVIEKLNLVEVKSSIFSLASRFISKAKLAEEMASVETRVQEIERELNFMRNELRILKEVHSKTI